MRVVFASHTHIGGVFVVGSHHLARELALGGHRVVHVSTPVTPLHLARLSQPGVRQRFSLWLHPQRVDNVLNVVPMAWLPRSVASRIPVFRQRDLMSTRRLRRIVHAHLGGPVDLLLVDQPKLLALTACLPARRTVYRPTDLYESMPGNAGVEDVERELVSRSDLVVATSEPVAQHIRDLAPDKRVAVLPNGFEYRHFARRVPRPAEYAEQGRTRAVYVGALDYRFDFEVVRILAAELPDIDFVLIGPTSRVAATELRGLQNVHLLGPRSYDRIPAYLQHAEIGLLTLNGHAANSGRSPMKLFEYAAAGLPVLLDARTPVPESATSFTRRYRTPEEAVCHLRQLSAGSPWAAEGGDDGRDGNSLSRIQEMSWERIAARLVGLALADEPD